MTTELIDKFNMLPPGARVLCALSGGADSVYLLRSLLELAPERGFFVCAAHYNHALRGAESDRDELFARELCRELDVPFLSEKGDVAAYGAARGIGLEQAAREKRYDFLFRAAERLGCQRIATAHNAGDNGETVLLNLARGAGLKGMGGIPPTRGILIRPMLLTDRREIKDYLARMGCAYVEDSSNALDDYARNRLRHSAVPALESVNGAFTKNASRAALLLREDEAFLDSLAAKFLEENSNGDGAELSALGAAPRPVASRALRLMAGAELRASQVEAVLALCAGEGLAYADVTGGRFTREQGRLRFGSAGAGPMESVTVSPPARLRIPERGLELRAEFTDSIPEINSSFNTFFFNCENICGIITCTSRIPGDRIRLDGRGCTKNLSDLFTERKTTQRQRDEALVLRDEQGPIAVQGFGVAQRCAGRPGEKLLRIDIISGEKL